MSDRNVGQSRWDQKIKSFRYSLFGMNAFLSIKQRRWLILGLNQNQCDFQVVLKHFFHLTLKYQFFYHITTSPDAPINCTVLMNILTIWKQFESTSTSLYTFILCMTEKSSLYENSVFLGKLLELQVFGLLLSVSDELSNFISSIVHQFFKHAINIVRVAAKFFYQVMWVCWKLFLENFILIVQPFCKKKSFHIFQINVCGMLELNVYSSWSLRKAQSCDNVVNSLPNIVSDDCSLPALLFVIDKISHKGHRRYCHCLYFRLPLNFK